MSPALLWLIAALAAVGIEVFTTDLTFALIGVGAATAGVAALVGAPLWLQAVIGVSVSILGIAFVRPVALRHLRRATPQTRTGVDRLPGADRQGHQRADRRRRSHQPAWRGLVCTAGP